VAGTRIHGESEEELIFAELFKSEQVLLTDAASVIGRNFI